jgi:protoheme IX farnesyltransferase
MLVKRTEAEIACADGNSCRPEDAQCLFKSLAPARRIFSVVSDCWTLTKPEVTFLIALTTSTGFYLGNAGQSGRFPFFLLAYVLLGTLLIAGGTGALNQYVEGRFDALMRRTVRRPLASGRMRSPVGLVLGIALATLGSVFLAVRVNLLASGLALFTLTSYLLIYTPLKRKSPAWTFIGAIPGAIPPLIGLAAAAGRLSSGA